jgi:hypothetical protein
MNHVLPSRAWRPAASAMPTRAQREVGALAFEPLTETTSCAWGMYRQAPAAMDIWGAAKRGDLGEVERLVGQDPTLLHALKSRFPFSWTPLVCASGNGHVEVVRWLSDKGAARHPGKQTRRQENPGSAAYRDLMLAPDEPLLLGTVQRVPGKRGWPHPCGKMGNGGVLRHWLGLDAPGGGISRRSRRGRAPAAPPPRCPHDYQPPRSRGQYGTAGGLLLGPPGGGEGVARERRRPHDRQQSGQHPHGHRQEVFVRGPP